METTKEMCARRKAEKIRQMEEESELEYRMKKERETLFLKALVAQSCLYQLKKGGVMMKGTIVEIVPFVYAWDFVLTGLGSTTNIVMMANGDMVDLRNCYLSPSVVSFLSDHQTVNEPE